MKIAPGAAPPPVPPKPAMPEEPPAQKFAGLLKGRSLSLTMPPPSLLVAPQAAGQQSAQAFAFGALGMFGRYGATANPAAEQDGADAAQPDGASDVIGMEGESAPAGQPASEIEVAAVSEFAPTEPAFAQAVAITVAIPSSYAVPSSATLPESCTLPMVPVMGGAEQSACLPDGEMDVPERQGAPARYLNSAATSDAGSLLVAGEDGALSIVARSPEAEMKRESLRRALRETAAEFGMQVSELRLSGENQVFTTALGGNRGSHAR